MNREEAIKYIKSRCIGSDEERDGTQWSEAMWMAIEALRNCSEIPNGSLISRQDAIEAVRKVWCDNDDRNDFKQRYYEMGNNDAVEDAIGYIDALPSADRPTGWIPVSERLPREYAQYLVCVKTGDCYVYWLEDSDWARGIAEKEGILAWMPLPPVYQGE